MTEDKKFRHERAEAFRQQIALIGERKEAIMALVGKESFDEADKQRVTILLSRVSLAGGCEKEYSLLINRLSKDDSLKAKARDFYKRWNA